MSDEDNVKKSNKLIAVVVVIIMIAVVGTGVALYVHSLPAKSSKVVITVAGPSYLVNDKVWSDYFNTSMSGWLSDHPNVTIKYVGPFGASTEAQYYTKLDLMTSSPTTAPDIMLEDMFYTATYVNSHTLLPLNNYVSSSVFSNMVQSGLGQLTVNGTHYGIPTQVTDTLIYYNTTLLNESGVHTPWQPHSWQGIINASEKVHAKFPTITAMNIYTGVNGDEASSFTGFEGLLYGTGWGLYNFTAHKWYGENPGLNSTLHFYKTVFGTGLASTALSSTPYITAGARMKEGKLGIDIDGSWMYGYQWASGSNQIHNFSKYIGVAKNSN
jgi:ABC-type sugar transport system, periplasmic component